MNREKAKVLVKELLLEGVKDERKIQAVAYLAELERYRRSGEKLTGVAFFRKDCGPHSPELASVVRNVRKGFLETLLRKKETKLLSGEELLVLDALSESLGDLPKEEVLREARGTGPYLSAKEGTRIRFSSTILTYPERETTLRELFDRRGVGDGDGERRAGDPEFFNPGG